MVMADIFRDIFSRGSEQLLGQSARASRCGRHRNSKRNPNRQQRSETVYPSAPGLPTGPCSNAIGLARLFGLGWADQTYRSPTVPDVSLDTIRLKGEFANNINDLSENSYLQRMGGFLNLRGYSQNSLIRTEKALAQTQCCRIICSGPREAVGMKRWSLEVHVCNLKKKL
jgi:hypothetical protein